MYTITATLFLIVIDKLLVDAIDREPNRGLLWQSIAREHLNDFKLADDVARLALADRSSVAGLTINISEKK